MFSDYIHMDTDVPLTCPDSLTTLLDPLSTHDVYFHADPTLRLNHTRNVPYVFSCVASLI